VWATAARAFGLEEPSRWRFAELRERAVRDAERKIRRNRGTNGAAAFLRRYEKARSFVDGFARVQAIPRNDPEGRARLFAPFLARFGYDFAGFEALSRLAGAENPDPQGCGSRFASLP